MIVEVPQTIDIAIDLNAGVQAAFPATVLPIVQADLGITPPGTMQNPPAKKKRAATDAVTEDRIVRSHSAAECLDFICQ